MNAAKMRKIAAMWPKMSVTQIAKSSELEMYSLTGNLQICRRAVMRAIRFAGKKKQESGGTKDATT